MKVLFEPEIAAKDERREILFAQQQQQQQQTNDMRTQSRSCYAAPM
jgi:hypothetical protein